MNLCGENSCHADIEQSLFTTPLGTLNYPPHRGDDEISYPRKKEVFKCLGIPGSIRRKKGGGGEGNILIFSWMHCGCCASPIILPTIQEIHVTALDVCDTFWRLPPLHARLCWFNTVHSSSNDISLTSVCSVSPFTAPGPRWSSLASVDSLSVIPLPLSSGPRMEEWSSVCDSVVNSSSVSSVDITEEFR